MGLSWLGIGGGNDRSSTTTRRRSTAPAPTTAGTAQTSRASTAPATGTAQPNPNPQTFNPRTPLPPNGNSRTFTGDPVGTAQPRDGATTIGATTPPSTGLAASSAIGAAQIAAVRARRRAGASAGSLLTGLNVRAQQPGARATLQQRTLVGA